MTPELGWIIGGVIAGLLISYLLFSPEWERAARERRAEKEKRS